MNNLSSVATKIVEDGLFKVHRNLPSRFTRLRDEMYSVPECPKDYPIAIEKDIVKKLGQIVVLVTGGLDSTVLYYQAIENFGASNVKAYYVDFGQSYADKEIQALQQLKIPYELITHEVAGIRDTGLYWKHIIPGRNLMLLSLVAERMMHGGEIQFGVVEGEGMVGGDKSLEFIKQVNTLFKTSLPYSVKVTCPLRDRLQTKADLVSGWLEKDNSIVYLTKTISCFSSDSGGSCWACQSCLRRWMAFRHSGAELMSSAVIKDKCSLYIEKYRTLMTQAIITGDFSSYSERRCMQDLEVINKYLS